jgi:hypothetical protein
VLTSRAYRKIHLYLCSHVVHVNSIVLMMMMIRSNGLKHGQAWSFGMIKIIGLVRVGILCFCIVSNSLYSLLFQTRVVFVAFVYVVLFFFCGNIFFYLCKLSILLQGFVIFFESCFYFPDCNTTNTVVVKYCLCHGLFKFAIGLFSYLIDNTFC